MIDVQLKGRLGQFVLEVAFRAPMQGVTALFGPSGCGKTSILRSIAGLQKIPGRIAIGPQVWQDKSRFVAPHKRPVGYVFQEASLFAHLSVYENLVYGQRRIKETKHQIHFNEVVELLGLERLIKRRPENLSGGERQRVSIGRALLSQPRLLLMDEPLSALDKQAKEEILPYFERLSRHLSLPIILVSHDLSEVERLANYLIALKDGRVLSAASLNDALVNPELPFSQSYDGAVILAGQIQQVDSDGIVTVDVQGQKILCPGGDLSLGAEVRMRIAARDVSIVREVPSQSSILNYFPARITHLQELNPSEINVHLSMVESTGVSFIARITKRSLKALELELNDIVIAQIKSVSLTELVADNLS